MTCRLCGKWFLRKVTAGKQTAPCQTRQLYCSPKCRDKRYRMTPKGRLNHRLGVHRWYYKRHNPHPIYALAEALQESRADG